MQNFRGCGVFDFVGRESGPHPQERREVVLQLPVRGAGGEAKEATRLHGAAKVHGERRNLGALGSQQASLLLSLKRKIQESIFWRRGALKKAAAWRI